MNEVALVWFTFGAANWLYGINHLGDRGRTINLGDFIVALPVCILIGPIPVLARWFK